VKNTKGMITKNGKPATQCVFPAPRYDPGVLHERRNHLRCTGFLGHVSCHAKKEVGMVTCWFRSTNLGVKLGLFNKLK
jgi:hypothetical protein